MTNVPSLTLLRIFFIVSVVVCIIACVFTKIDLKKHPLKKTKRKKRFYASIEPYALNIKISLQMLVGLGLVVLLIIKLMNHLLVPETQLPLLPDLPLLLSKDTFLNKFVYQQRTLTIVGFALAYSTAIELAYTLFTPGPDEAINPLVLGLSATILILLSNVPNFDISTAVFLALLVVVLVGLYYFSQKFIKDDDEDTDETNDVKAAPQIPQDTDNVGANPLNVTGSFQITTLNQAQADQSGFRLWLHKLFH